MTTQNTTAVARDQMKACRIEPEDGWCYCVRMELPNPVPEGAQYWDYGNGSFVKSGMCGRAPGLAGPHSLYRYRPAVVKVTTVAEKDISTELRRTYTWADGASVTIFNPVTLIVSKNGHRIADAANNGHYIPLGWIHLYWENKPGVRAIVA